MIVQEAIFFTKEGVKDNDFMQSLKELSDEYISLQTGFVNRFYLKHDDRKWILYIFFNSNEDANKAFNKFTQWDKSDHLLIQIKPNGITVRNYDLPVDLNKVNKHYNSMIAQELLVPLKETTTDEEMVNIFKMLITEYFSNYKGYINSFFAKYNTRRYLLYVFFDSDEHAIGCITDFQAWDKSHILINAIYEDKLNIKHFEINNPLL